MNFRVEQTEPNGGICHLLLGSECEDDFKSEKVEGQEGRTLFCRRHDLFVKALEAVCAEGAVQYHGCRAPFSDVGADGRGRRAGRRENVVKWLQLHWRLLWPGDTITLS